MFLPMAKSDRPLLVGGSFKKTHIMLLAVLIFFRNYAKIMLSFTESMLLTFYTDFKETKDHQWLNSINFDFNEHSRSPPSSLTVFSIANTHVRTSKSHMIKVLVTALEVLEVVEVDVLEGVEDDAIFDLRPEGPSRRAISVVA